MLLYAMCTCKYILKERSRPMVLKRYFTISILIILCFFSSFCALFHGFSTILQAKENVSKEIRYGYQNKVQVSVDSPSAMKITDLFQITSKIKQCNIYIDDMKFYFDESSDTFCPLILLCQNESLPYPTKEHTQFVSEGGLLVPNNIPFDTTYITIHQKQIPILDQIDTTQYKGLNDYFVLTAKDYFDLFRDSNTTTSLSFQICSNKVDLYHSYKIFEQCIKKLYPDSLISYEDVEQNSSLLSGALSNENLLSIFLYLFSLINVMIISFYWVNIRRKEISIRKAFGATNLSIFFLFLRETLLIISIAAGIAFLIQLILQCFFREAFAFSDWIAMSLFYVCMIMLATLVAICIPMRSVLKIQPAKGVKGS